jgi:threonine synthase
MVTLGEGNTPFDSISYKNKILVIKREDKNPSGSWKDRATAYKLSSLIENNIHEAVLFSSGNALISFLYYIKSLRLDFKLHAVVSNKIKEEKLFLIKELINGTTHDLVVSNKPKHQAVEISAKNKIPNLRMSLDNEVVRAYWVLGEESAHLIKNNDNLEVSIFCPASSGTAVVGIAEGLFGKLGTETKMPRIYVCQTQSVHPFLAEGIIICENSKADAIVDTVGLRVSQIRKIVDETNGEIFAITNEELDNAKNFAQENNLGELSYNSLLSIAGFLRKPDSQKNICIASGR